MARRLLAAEIDLAGLDWVASPLARTRETMEILRRALDLDPDGYRREPGFVELGFGAWEGMTWREIRRSDPGRAAERARDKWGYVPPGGESYAALAERLAAPLAALSRPTLLVSHGGVARALLHLLAGLSTEEAPRTDIWQGRLLILRKGGSSWS